MLAKVLIRKIPALSQVLVAVKTAGSLSVKPNLDLKMNPPQAMKLLQTLLSCACDVFLYSLKLEKADYPFSESEASSFLSLINNFSAEQLFLLSGIVKNKSMSATLMKVAKAKGWRSALEEQPFPQRIEDWSIDIQNIIAREGKNKLRFLGYSQSSKFVRLRFYPETIETRVKAIALYDEDIMTRLSVRLPVITPHPGHIAMDITLPEDQWTTPLLRDHCLPVKGTEIVFPVCIDVEGRLLSVPVSDPRYCHWLVGATTGGGKSVWLTQMIASLSRYDSSLYRLTVIDFKVEGVSLDFDWLDETDMPARVITHKSKALEFLEETVSTTYKEKMERCAKAKVTGVAIYNKSQREPMPWDIIVIDEYADLMTLAQGDEEEQKEYKAEASRIDNLVTSMAARGRAAGITLVICTQRPDVTVVSGLLRNNLPAIVGLKMKDPINTKIIFGDIDAPAHKLLGKGDLFFRAAGEDYRGQSLFVETEQAIQYVKSNLEATESNESICSTPG